MKLDNYDLKLLTLLQKDVRTSIDKLSETIGLSTASGIFGTTIQVMDRRHT